MVECSPEAAVRVSRERAAKLWRRCPSCREVLERERLERRAGVCESCGHHLPLSPARRIEALFDQGSFRAMHAALRSDDPLRFGDGGYAREVASSGKEAMVCGTGSISGAACVAAVMDFSFFGGSMGTVVGELFCRCCELCAEMGLPLLSVTASGGARMQEGTAALLQMAKVIAALKALEEEELGYVSLLCDPTCGGVTASFATAADVILAEPGALICFSGPRVVEQTTGMKLPPGFSRAEEHLKRGLVDMVVPRDRQREVLGGLLRFFSPPRDQRRAVKAGMKEEEQG